jgi:hypothetical protein
MATNAITRAAGEGNAESGRSTSAGGGADDPEDAGDAGGATTGTS